MIAKRKERRAFPRFPITFPIKVGLTGPNGKLQFNAECVELSRSSIQISCDSHLIEALLAQEEYPHMAKLDFKMPDRSRFSVASQVVTHRRLAQNHYYLVLVYTEFHEGSDELLAGELRDFEPGGLRVGSA